MKKIESTKILTLLTLFSSALFSIITPMAKELTLALALDGEEQVAFINSMFLIVGALSSLVWAVLGDKYSRKKLLIVATLEWAILMFFTIFATNFYSLLTFQLFTAIGFGAALPLVFSLNVDLVKPEKRGGKFGILSATYVLGNGVGQMLSGFLIDFYTWQVPIIIISMGGFACTALLFTIKEPNKGAMDDLYKSIDDKALGLSYKIKLSDFKEILKVKSTICILILNFAIFVSIGAISSFFISMLKNDFLLPSAIATLFLIIVFGGQVPSGPIFGKMADRKRERDTNGRIKVVLICLFSGASFYIIGYSLAFISKDLIVAIVFLIFAFCGAFMLGGVDACTQATLGEINPPQTRSTIYSINFLASVTIGRSISLLILGQLYLTFNYQYSPGYLILSIMALACTLLVIPILKLLPRDIEKIKTSKKVE